ncbi:MAG: diguanylate cyclase [Bradymonadales bacterium]|nr:diguanylate cyclase [Bradymonadales bacterium]
MAPPEKPEILSVEKRDEAIGDAFAITMAVIGGSSPTEILDRLTSFLAGRLNTAECACLVMDNSTDQLALVCAADAYDRDHRGQKIPGDHLSEQVHFILDRALDWARHGLTSQVEDSGLTSSDRPLPILKGPLVKPSQEQTMGSSAGLIVPIVHQRRVVGVQWLGGLGGERPGDWPLTLLHTVAVVEGQAIGAILKEREQHELVRNKHLDYQTEINRLEKANEKLRTAFYDRNKTLAMSAHEFRVPLGIIQGHLSTMRNLTALTDTQRTTVSAIEKQCHRLLEMIEEVLIARQRERQNLVLEPCDLTPLLQAWSEEYRNLAQKGFFMLEVHIQEELGIRKVDPRRLNSLITSLLLGAFKSTSGQNPLTLTIELKDDLHLHIHLTDLLDSQLATYQAEPVSFTAAGLVEVKELAELHGGQLEVVNYREGGSRYTILLPALLDDAASEDTNPLPAKTGRVLIIDPDKEALYHIASSLALHFEVLTARTEREAFWLLQQFPIDCAIVDLNFPLMTGFATAAELRRDPRRVRLPILFTAEVDPAGMALRRQGELVEDVLVKPIDPDTLVARVNQALSDMRERELSSTATRMDTLTGLMSRSTAARELDAQLERSVSRRAFLTILLIDIDGMVEINKRHGRGIGNELIHEMGKTLNSVTRSQEFTARWGGDEFLCILPATSQPSGKSAGERLRERLARCHADNVSTTVSIGGATLDPRQPIKSTNLLNHAETALRAAKALGGNKVIIWKDSPASVSS